MRAGSRWPFTCKPDADGHRQYIPFPFFLAYAAAVLEKDGKNVRLIDAVAEEASESQFVQNIITLNPGFILVETSTPSFKNDMRIIETLRQGVPNVKIGLCGSHVGEFVSEILSECRFVDFILIGEYEHTLLELVNSFQNSSRWGEIAGLAYREGDSVVVNGRRVPISNLDILPWPERVAPLIYKYNDGFAGLPCPSVQMLASRGCPFKCTFCLLPQTLYKGSGYRKRNCVDVVDEMEYLIKRFNFKAVYFDDEVFNADREQVVSICREINRRNMKTPWAAMARVDFMDEELLKIMSEAGLYAVKYGIESADEGIRKLCKKHLDLDKARSIIKITKELGIKVHLTFCIGLPGETRMTVQHTVDFIKKIDPDSFQFTFATPFPGTEYFNYASDMGWLGSRDWDDYDGNKKFNVRTRDLSTADLEKIKAELLHGFKDKTCCL